MNVVHSGPCAANKPTLTTPDKSHLVPDLFPEFSINGMSQHSATQTDAAETVVHRHAAPHTPTFPLSNQ